MHKEETLSPSTRFRPHLELIQHPTEWVLGSFLALSCRGVKLNTHRRLEPKFRMRATTFLLFLYGFMACSEKTLPLLSYFFILHHHTDLIRD
jgi:hypothetical protein